ncbi:MAG: hypothetical protein AAF990_26345 [Bacteroidota bacterium]
MPQQRCLLSLLALFNCTTNHDTKADLTPLIGKWKVNEPKNEFIIHNSKDSLWEMYSYEMPGEIQLNIHQHEEGKIQQRPCEKGSIHLKKSMQKRQRSRTAK